ncbi:SDR family NAD(P)-dependent oxidoreductase [Streptomyces sp. SID13031]|uniref:SDR family NAD(P)-dependent oxidoreductase n=1 Tax=Streptomyces sp. SID13031 TaxID=2706046 RepID=UPI0013C8AAF2|nr:SDR family NAD(P)-dependent oxidoreductase [Streptomyces sp. SID13031]NEA33527.1 SDR family NAD(P)-dependent oxidoreductase [Streptomyces sp. SID13031]
MSRAMDVAGRRIWVVGASSGIGAALARELCRRGAHVAISARRADALQAVAGEWMTAVPCDITDADDVRQAADVVAAELGGIDIAVLSAGYWKQMGSDFDVESINQHLKVNVGGMANCLGELIPRMNVQGAGVIVGISSVAGYRGLPGSEAYGASKAAQINLLEALRVRLRPDGIDVITVCPGFVKTEMTEQNTFPMPFMVSAEQAGRAIADGIEKQSARIVFPWQMSLLMRVAKLVPDRLWAIALTPRS